MADLKIQLLLPDLVFGDDGPGGAGGAVAGASRIPMFGTIAGSGVKNHLIPGKLRQSGGAVGNFEMQVQPVRRCASDLGRFGLCQVWHGRRGKRAVRCQTGRQSKAGRDYQCRWTQVLCDGKTCHWTDLLCADQISGGPPLFVVAVPNTHPLPDLVWRCDLP